MKCFILTLNTRTLYQFNFLIIKNGFGETPIAIATKKDIHPLLHTYSKKTQTPMKPIF